MCLKKLSWAPTSTRAEMWLISRSCFVQHLLCRNFHDGNFLQLWCIFYKHTAGFWKRFGSSSTDTQLWCLVVGLQGAGGSRQKWTCFISWSGRSCRVRQDRPVNCNLPLLQPEFVSKIDFAEGEDRRTCYGIKMAETGGTVLKKIQLGVKGQPESHIDSFILVFFWL